MMSAGRCVVLVHGIFHSSSAFGRMGRYLRSRGFRTFAPNLKPSTGRRGLDELAEVLRNYIESELPTEEFDLIGFSMGGLVCRYYLQRLGGLARVGRFLAISTPHTGSQLAYALGNRGCRQMRPGSEFLRDLNKDAHVLEQVRVVSIWTPFDLSVFPSQNSRFSVGTEIRFPIALHPLMIRDRRVFDAVARLL